MKCNRLFRLLFLILLIGLRCQIAPAQDPAHWQLTDENGLPSMTVYQIAQDGDGYMWIGTSNGICRYDGKEITNYSHRIMNDNEIIGITMDTFNNIFFRNLSNQVFLINNDVVTPLKEIINEELVSINDIAVIDDYLYMVFQIKKNEKNEFKLGRYKINEKGGLSEKFIFEVSFNFWKPMVKYKNHLVFPHRKTNTSNYFWNKITNGNNTLIKMDKLNEADTKNLNSTLSPFHQDQLLLFKFNGRTIQKFEKGRVDLLLELSENNNITNIDKIQDRNFVLTKKGIIVENEKQKFDQGDLIFSGINCNKIIADRENNYWIGTTGHGIIFIPSLEMKIYNSKNSMLANEQIFCLDWNKKDGEIYVGHNEAKFSILSKQKVTTYNLNASGRILDITQTQTQNDHLLLASDSKPIIVQNVGEINQRDVPLEKLQSGIKTFFVDSQNRIFIGTSNRVLMYQNEKELNQSLRVINHILLKKRTYAIGEDFQNGIWLGTTEGIFIYKNKEVKPFSSDPKNDFYVSSITPGNDSMMWVSTLGEGIIGYKNGEEVARFNLENGLASNNCKKVVEDGENLWIVTNKGLNILNQASGKIELINKTDGLPTDDLSDIILTENEIWIGTSKGLINFPKNLSHRNLVAPTIHISALKIWERDTTLSTVYELDHHQNNFQIEFVGLGFRSKGNISYQYKLSGVDANWVSTDLRTVRYPTLNPGAYTFEVFAINEDGIKSKNPAIIYFSIATPWWKTWWFWTLMALLFFGLIGVVFYWRLQRIQEKERLELEFSKKVNALEQKALQMQMNPHFIYNTLNSIQYFLTVNDAKFAMIYLSRFAKMIRMIFEQSKKSGISIEEEVDFLKTYLKLEQLRFKDKVDVEINVSEQLKDNGFELKIPPLLLQPLIENAFKHGLFQKEEKGLIKVDFNLENNFLLCIIEDDGVGREKAKEKDDWKPKDYISSGINTTKDRLKMLNELSDSKEESEIQIIDMYDQNNRPSGTRVIVKIKCKD
ncbi:MAG: histidine kinase [Saprospiraceae bacterium]